MADGQLRLRRAARPAARPAARAHPRRERRDPPLPRRELGVRARPRAAPAWPQTLAPASAVMERALGPPGARLIAAGIAISTLGFLSQSMLTAPRVYYAMAEDGVFFERVGAHPSAHARRPCSRSRCRAPSRCCSTAWGQYRQILDYMIAVDFVFFGLTATCLFVFRRRDPTARGRGRLPRARPSLDDGALRRRLLAVRGEPGRAAPARDADRHGHPAHRRSRLRCSGARRRAS